MAQARGDRDGMLNPNDQPTDVYGGDEVSAIVLDPGFSTTRAGFAGEDTPKQAIPSFYSNAHGRDVFGDEALYPRESLEVRHYMKADGIIDDWDAAMRMWEFLLVKRLSPPRGSSLGEPSSGSDGGGGDVEMTDAPDPNNNSVNARAANEAPSMENLAPLAENPLLVTEPAWNTPKARERTIEVVMETWGCPAFWLARSPVLASYAAGKPSALVIDVGASQASAVAVHDGMMLRRSVQRSPAGGNWLSGQIRRMWASCEPPVAIVPTFMIENKKPVEAGAPPDCRLKRFPFEVQESFRKYEEERVITEFKESVVEVWRGPGRYLVPGVEELARSQPGRVFEMPDGSNQMWKEQRHRVAEGMWDENAGYGNVGEEGGRLTAQQTLPVMIRECLSGVDVDLRPNLLGNVVVTGAGSLINGFTERLNNELSGLYPGVKVKLHAAGLTSERRFGAWVGGSILASLGTFHQMWISRKEYEENGAGIAEKRCK